MTIKQYDTIILLKDMIEGEDFLFNSKQTIKKGSIGTVVELLGDDKLLVEFSSTDYHDPVVSVPISFVNKHQ